MATKRFLGEPDAADDSNLAAHFVRPHELEELLSYDSQIVFGTKGSGKTALRRAMTELNSDRFFGASTVDLDNLSFERVHAELQKIGSAIGSDSVSMARSTWKRVLTFYCLDAAGQSLEDGSTLRKDIEEALGEERFTAPEASSRLLSLLLRAGELLYDDHASGTRTAGRSVQDAFPASPILQPLLVRACEVIERSRKRVAICIDGFDSILDHAPESRRAVFAGLIDAIFRLSRDRTIGKAFCFKAFLPRELTREAQSAVWDEDKHLRQFLTLHWTDDALRDFISKRLRQHLRTPKRGDSSFDVIWHEFMPSSIRNGVHDQDESSFDYILRHTQYRPRQLLYHVQAILDAWDSRSDTFRVDASFVPRIVQEASRRLAETTAHQLEFSRAGVETFLRSWGGTSSTISYGECFSKILRLFNLGTDNIAGRVLFDELFQMGVLGVARSATRVSSEKRLSVRFSFVGDGVVAPLQPKQEDTVALCPMFSEYFACRPSAFGIVVPVAA